MLKTERNVIESIHCCSKLRNGKLTIKRLFTVSLMKLKLIEIWKFPFQELLAKILNSNLKSTKNFQLIIFIRSNSVSAKSFEKLSRFFSILEKLLLFWKSLKWKVLVESKSSEMLKKIQWSKKTRNIHTKALRNFSRNKQYF